MTLKYETTYILITKDPDQRDNKKSQVKKTNQIKQKIDEKLVNNRRRTDLVRQIKRQI